jgi:hypothetical protein
MVRDLFRLGPLTLCNSTFRNEDRYGKPSRWRWNVSIRAWDDEYNYLPTPIHDPKKSKKSTRRKSTPNANQDTDRAGHVEMMRHVRGADSILNQLARVVPSKHFKLGKEADFEKKSDGQDIAIRTNLICEKALK